MINCQFCGGKNWKTLNGKDNYECLICGARIHYKVTARPRPDSPVFRVGGKQ